MVDGYGAFESDNAIKRIETLINNDVPAMLYSTWYLGLKTPKSGFYSNSTFQQDGLWTWNFKVNVTSQCITELDIVGCSSTFKVVRVS